MFYGKRKVRSEAAEVRVISAQRCAGRYDTAIVAILP
jgi:hypothetical protein